MGTIQGSMSREGHRFYLGASDPDEVDPDLVAARTVHRRPDLYQRGEWVKNPYVERGIGRRGYAEDLRTVAVELYLELKDDSLLSDTDLRREVAELIGCNEATVLYWAKADGLV